MKSRPFNRSPTPSRTQTVNTTINRRQTENSQTRRTHELWAMKYALTGPESVALWQSSIELVDCFHSKETKPSLTQTCLTVVGRLATCEDLKRIDRRGAWKTYMFDQRHSGSRSTFRKSPRYSLVRASDRGKQDRSSLKSHYSKLQPPGPSLIPSRVNMIPIQGMAQPALAKSTCKPR